MRNITTRQKKILRILCGQKDFISTIKIANQLGVSSKTIARELSVIDQWLDKKEILLEKKTRYGLRIIASDLQRRQLLEAINREDVIMVFTQEDRQILNLLALLKEKEPIKLYALASNLNVTESTISHDLDKLEGYLKEYNILLIRKPGVGVYLQGKESDIRSLSIDLIHENLEIRILVRIKDHKNNDDQSLLNNYVKKRVLDLVDMSCLQDIDKILKELEKQMKINFVETSYDHLIIHILLMMERIKEDKQIELSADLEEELKKTQEWEIAIIIKDRIKEHLKIDLPKEELAYLSIHLTGIKRYNAPVLDEKLTSDNFRIVKLAKDIIKLTESETGMFLDGNDELFAILTYHLIAGISRMRMKLPIRNPFVDEIKKQYPEVFQIAIECAHLIEERFLIKVPETEVGYLAMHLGGVIVRTSNMNEKVYQVVISCVLGICSSSLLKSRIEKEFPNIRVVDVLRIEDIESDYLEDTTIDFIISTVAVASPYKPSISVNPILLQEDKDRIKKFILEIPQKNRPISQSETSFSEEKLHDLKDLLTGIGNILDNFRIHHYEKMVTLAEIIKDISGILGTNREEKEAIKTALIEREKYGSTILSKDQAMLLHCRTSGLSQLHFQLIRLKEPLQVDAQSNETIDLILVMIAPEACSDNHLGIMGHISQMLIENKNFINNLRAKQSDDLKSYLNKLLLHYYQGKI